MGTRMQRYRPYQSEMWPNDDGEYMLVTDAEADKAEAIEANQLDKTATCGDCRLQPPDKSHWICAVNGTTFDTCHACVRLEKKPPASETEKPKAKFFRSRLGNIWADLLNESVLWYWHVDGRFCHEAENTLKSLKAEHLECTIADARKIIADADWPEGLAKFDELTKGETDAE